MRFSISRAGCSSRLQRRLDRLLVGSRPGQSTRSDRAKKPCVCEVGPSPPREIPQLAVWPTQFNSQRLLWTPVFEVKAGELTSMRLDSGIAIDWPIDMKAPYEWSVLSADGTQALVQRLLSNRSQTPLPPGEYLLAVRPTQFNSEALIWPRKIAIKPGERAVVKLDSSIRIEVPKDLPAIYEWDVVTPGKEQQRVQWHLGDHLTTFMPPGEYQISFLPTQFNSRRLLWPAKIASQGRGAEPGQTR